MKTSQALILLFITTLILHCQTPKKVRFEPTNNDIKIMNAAIVKFGRPWENVEILGKLPVEIELDRLQGDAIKLSAPGYEDQFWVFSEKLGESNIIKINLKRKADNQAKLEQMWQKAALLLLKSYKALIEKNNDLAIDLANQSEKELNLGPSTHIIKILAQAQSGNISEAQKLLEEAIALYPDVSELKELKKMLNRWR